MISFLIIVGKLIARLSTSLGKGNGSTWPGHIALSVHKTFIRDLQQKSHIRIILIVGTNGKTTTAKMLATILKYQGKKVIQNTSGANLLNGIASTLLLQADWRGNITADFAIFEIDENVLPYILEEISPFAIVALNLFRDQLDRYGELDSIVKKWKKALDNIPTKTQLFLNADDPQVAYLGNTRNVKIHYFGLQEKGTTTLQHAADALYCPNCNHRLHFEKVYYSHLGMWSCPHCGYAHPKPQLTTFYFPLPGLYNKYNTLAAVLVAQKIGIPDDTITLALHEVKPAFGRQEKIIKDGKIVQLFLAKNPTSFNQSLQTIHELGAKYVLFILNDRIPDGRDVSWIWDMDLENYVDAYAYIGVSGDRVYDMALRIQYAAAEQKNISSFEDYIQAIETSLQRTPNGQTLYILPTYSAMLLVRKHLLGRKIL